MPINIDDTEACTPASHNSSSSSSKKLQANKRVHCNHSMGHNHIIYSLIAGILIIAKAKMWRKKPLFSTCVSYHPGMVVIVTPQHGRDEHEARTDDGVLHNQQVEIPIYISEIQWI